MGESQDWKFAPLLREYAKSIDHSRKASGNQRECFSLQNRIGITNNILTRRTEMKDCARRDSLISQRMDVRHHIVTQSLFVLGRSIEVDRIKNASNRFDVFCSWAE